MSPCPKRRRTSTGQLLVCEYDRPHAPPCCWWAPAEPNRREDGKPVVTCENGGEQGFDATTIEGGPGSAPTPPDLADPSREGASNGER